VNPAIEDRFRKNAKTLGKPFADTSRNIAALFPVILPSLKSKNRPVTKQGQSTSELLAAFFKKRQCGANCSLKKQL
jgi:hypothetical protein